LANRYAEAIAVSAEVKLELLGELDPLQRLETVVQVMSR
jgi:hypothetical protein